MPAKKVIVEKSVRWHQVPLDIHRSRLQPAPRSLLKKKPPIDLSGFAWSAPSAELTEDGIKAFCKKNLHDWKCPKQIIFLEEIPRNTMGKVLKEEVKKIILE